MVPTEYLKRLKLFNKWAKLSDVEDPDSPYTINRNKDDEIKTPSNQSNDNTIIELGSQPLISIAPCALRVGLQPTTSVLCRSSIFM